MTLVTLTDTCDMELSNCPLFTFRTPWTASLADWGGGGGEIQYYIHNGTLNADGTEEGAHISLSLFQELHCMLGKK